MIRYRLFSILCISCLALSLAACGDDDGGSSNTNDDDEYQPYIIEGQSNYRAEDHASISAYGNVDAITGRMEADGSFTIELPHHSEFSPSSFTRSMGEEISICRDDEVIFDREVNWIGMVTYFVVRHYDAGVSSDGDMALGVFPDGEIRTSTRRGETRVSWVHVDEAVTMQGECGFDDDSRYGTSIDLHLEKGWNEIIHIGLDEDDNIPRSLVTGERPAEVEWYTDIVFED